MSWLKQDNGLQKEFQFTNQTQLAEFVLQLARLSDEKEHHADMLIRYNRLQLNWTTHDKGGITDRDYEMAVCTDELYDRFVK